MHAQHLLARLIRTLDPNGSEWPATICNGSVAMPQGMRCHPALAIEVRIAINLLRSCLNAAKHYKRSKQNKMHTIDIFVVHYGKQVMWPMAMPNTTPND